MNNKLYLSKITIPSFRNYIHDFSLEIPDEPGLTVIVGANGLGKSTILHGIEWGLTGKVERIETAPNTNERNRARSLGSNASVELLFNNDFKIFRNANATESSIKDLDERIRKNLINQNWGGIDDFAASLQFTHFRGQSALQHFTNQKGSVRFDRLKGASRLSGLIDAQKKLERPKTTMAFSRVKDSLQKEKARLSEDRHKFEELISEKERLSSFARAEKALAPDEVMSALSQMKSKCVEIGMDVSCLPDTLSPKANIPGVFEKIQEELQGKEKEFAKLEEVLRRWVTDAETYEVLRRGLGRDVESQNKLECQFQIAKKELQEAIEKQDTLKIESQQVRKEFDASSEKLEKLQELKTCQNDLVSKNKELDIQEQILAELGQKIKTEENRCADAEKASKEADIIHEKIKGVHSGINTISGIRDSHNSVSAKNSELNELFEFYEKSKDVLSNSAHIESDLRKEIADLKTKRIELEGRLRESRSNVRAIQAAVATIASELDEGEQNCPVCTTQHAKGLLKKIAQESADRNSPKILELERELKTLTDKQNELFEKQEDVILQKNTAHEIVEQFEALKKSINKEIATLQDFNLLKGLKFEDMHNVLEQAMSDSKNQLVLLEKEKPSANNYKTISDTLLKTRECYQQVKESLGLSENNKNLLLNLITVLQGRVEALNDELDINVEVSSNFENLIKDQARLCANFGRKIKSTEYNELESIEIRKQKEEIKIKTLHNLEEVRALLVNMNAEIDESKNSWSRDGFDDEPSTIQITKKSSQIKSERDILKSLEEKHRALLESYKVWQGQEDLKNSERKIYKFLSGFSVDSLDGIVEYFNKKEEWLRKKDSNLLNAENARNELIQKIRERLKNVEREAFKPLNHMLGKFSSALMTGWDFQIFANAEFKKASTIAGVVLRTPQNEALLPELTLSEGQMAAMELSLMFSASEIYPWSPWKALVLDDPLQHNDTIHAASFIEVVRNMIKDQGYQVIITTHDVDEASYFLRKCRNVGVETQYCHLLSKIDGKLMYNIG